MIQSICCCSARPSLWSPSGRHCPSSRPRSRLQGTILHLSQRKNPQPLVYCLLGLNSELAMDEPVEDKPLTPPSETSDCVASVQVDASLLRYIVGKGGKMKAKIEEDTSTCLQIPSEREAKKGRCIVVKGASKVMVDNAISEIHRVVEEVVESPTLDYSHFISLPLSVHPDFVLQVTKFHDSVMGMLSTNKEDDVIEPQSVLRGKSTSEQVEGGDFDTEKTAESNQTELPRQPDKGHGIEESIFIKPATLHLTLLMLKLWNKERVTTAIEVLKGLQAKLLETLDHRPIAVRLRGVECMRGSPAKAHVLYARVFNLDEDSRLLCMCKIIKEAFIEAGLVSDKDKKQELKLHVTLMNTSYRKRKPGKKFGRRIPFDARPILSIHGAEEWGEYRITETHLSERFKYDEDGYYHCCASVKFPSGDLTA